MVCSSSTTAIGYIASFATDNKSDIGVSGDVVGISVISILSTLGIP